MIDVATIDSFFSELSKIAQDAWVQESLPRDRP
jgi:hypothetical protein